MNTRFLLGFAAAALVLTASLTRAGDLLIVPGERIGDLHLGPNGAAEMAKLSSPNVSDAGMSKRDYLWLSNHGGQQQFLYVHTVMNGATDAKPVDGQTIEAVRVTSPEFHTKSGIATGNTVKQILASYPKAAASKDGEANVLYDQGVAFEFEGKPAPSAKCIAISIFKPGVQIVRTSAWIKELNDSHSKADGK